MTALSVLIALMVGGLEPLNLIGDHLDLTGGGGFWGAVGVLSDNFGILGYAIFGIFIAAWLIAFTIYKFNRYDAIEGPA